MIRVHLTQCSYNKPGGESHGCFNNDVFTAATLEDALEGLKESYGIVPPKKPKGVYADTLDGKTRQVGFMHYRWVPYQDRSTTKARHYFEENWISFDEQTITPFSLPKELQAAI
jgi:hypothetical protein